MDDEVRCVRFYGRCCRGGAYNMGEVCSLQNSQDEWWIVR